MITKALAGVLGELAYVLELSTHCAGIVTDAAVDALDEIIDYLDEKSL